MAGLITYNGALLLAGGGLAGNKNCCCSGVVCYCFREYTNYGSTTIRRWVVCYRQSYYDPVLGRMVFPDGVPCGYGEATCPPGTFGWFFIGGNNQLYTTPPWGPNDPPVGFPLSCGCGGSQQGTGITITLISNAEQAASCTPVLPPP